MSDNYLCITLHGAPGSGKTSQANTLPGPRLMLDTEGSGGYLRNPHVHWDMLEQEEPPLPEGDNSDLTVIVDIPDWETYRIAMDYLLAGKHPFESAILDSLTEIQTQLKEYILPQHGYGQEFEKTTHATWDQLLVHLERDVRALRNMTRPSAPKRMHTAICVLSDMESVPVKPLIQGALGKRLPQFTNMVGYMYKLTDQQGRKRFVMRIEGSDNEVVAKCNIPRVNDKWEDGRIFDPDLRRIIKVANTEEES